MKPPDTFENLSDTGAIDEIDKEPEPHKREDNSQGSQATLPGTLIYRMAHDCNKESK